VNCVGTIDTGEPRLSWVNESDRNGDRQSAYRIIVRTSERVVLTPASSDFATSSKSCRRSVGATTLWERWENLSGVGMNSHNHIMFGSVDTWFCSTRRGIRMTQPAWRGVRIEPWFAPALVHAAATVETVQGTVGVEWRREADAVLLRVEIPVGAQADVALPPVRHDLVGPAAQNAQRRMAGPDGSAIPLPAGVHEIRWRP
jgi:hypothetical protein